MKTAPAIRVSMIRARQIKVIRGLLLMVFGVSAVISSFGQSKRPSIGLTLSGGGAKGLAHIGILKAIDSAGLKVDYITGTSMGSIMGALYAVGYSGKKIEEIARSIDWVGIFSNRPPLELINMNEKREFSNYAVEIPFENRKARFYSGLIEAEEVWLKFGELFYPVHTIKDFSKFSIPFQCIATDAATGKAVVLSEGEIVKAVRASMAIPSIFSAVPYKNTKLIDGGVVRNFPVQDAKKMGANFVIGVNLSQGLMPAEKLVSSIDVLYQIAFYKDADDFELEKKMCDLLIEPPVSNFSAASFGSVDSLLSIGNNEGRKYYPVFKRMADSLRRLYPESAPRTNRLPTSENVIIDEIVPVGLKTISQKDFEGKLGLTLGKSNSAKEISEAGRQAFSTGNFRRLATFLEPTQAGHARLRCEVIENARNFLKVGIHFHSYTDIALITTFATRNLIFQRSKSFAKINWSDNARILLRHDQSFGKRERWGALMSFYYEKFRFPIYQDYKLESDYTSQYTTFDLKIYKLFGRTAMMGIGTAHEQLGLQPNITSLVTFTGNNTYWNTYLFFQKNNLDLKIFPHKGSYVDFQAGLIYGQKPDYKFITQGGSISSDTLNIVFDPYQQVKLKYGKYFPLSPKWTILAQTNHGINFNYKASYFNFYSVGGINDFIRNQIPFVGLTENQVNAHSISTLLAGIQFEPVPNLLATLKANVGIQDYLDSEMSNLSFKNFLSGYALSAGYRSALGPIEISLIYSDQAKQFKGYVNIGFTF